MVVTLPVVSLLLFFDSIHCFNLPFKDLLVEYLKEELEWFELRVEGSQNLHDLASNNFNLGKVAYFPIF